MSCAAARSQALKHINILQRWRTGELQVTRFSAPDGEMVEFSAMAGVLTLPGSQRNRRRRRVQRESLVKTKTTKGRATGFRITMGYLHQFYGFKVVTQCQRKYDKGAQDQFGNGSKTPINKNGQCIPRATGHGTFIIAVVFILQRRHAWFPLDMLLRNVLGLLIGGYPLYVLLVPRY